MKCLHVRAGRPTGHTVDAAADSHMCAVHFAAQWLVVDPSRRFGIRQRNNRNNLNMINWVLSEDTTEHDPTSLESSQNKMQPGPRTILTTVMSTLFYYKILQDMPWFIVCLICLFLLKCIEWTYKCIPGSAEAKIMKIVNCVEKKLFTWTIKAGMWLLKYFLKVCRFTLTSRPRDNSQGINV